MQTTAGSHNLGELEAIADFAHDRLAAKVWNLYFLVPTGRGQFVSDITPAQYDEVLASLYRIQRKYDRPDARERQVRAALHQDRPGAGRRGPIRSCGRRPAKRRHARHVPIRTYSGGAGGCPAGTHYMGIRPNGDVTPCPYLPVFAGTLRSASLADLWTSSELFTDIRRRTVARRTMRRVRDERPLRRLPRPGLRHDRRPDGRRSAVHAHAGHVRRVAAARRCGQRAPARPPGRARSNTAAIAATIAWDEAAAARMKKIPAFVRGMVVRAVEESCRKNGLDRVTVEELERIRARMPTPKMFG